MININYDMIDMSYNMMDMDYDNGTFKIRFNDGQLKEYDCIHDVAVSLNVSQDTVTSWFIGSKIPDKKYNICDLRYPEWWGM